jgi:hypothetical protein
MYLPAKYVPMLLDANLSPCDAWIFLCNNIETNKEHQDCVPLIEWLHVTLTRQAALLPLQLLTDFPVTPPMLASPANMSAFINYRWRFVD